jgi:hypothetical protein
MAAFVRALGQMASKQTTVLIFDNLDAVPTRLDRDRLETELFSKLGKMPTIKSMVVSRGQAQWRGPELDQIYGVLYLPPFDEDYVRDLTCLIWPELMDREAYLHALKVSGGHPYSVMRLARVGSQCFDLSEAELYQRLMEELWTNVITRFMLKGVSSTLQGLLSQISIVRSFDMSGLKYFSKRADLFPDERPSRFVEVLDALNRDVNAIRFDDVHKGYRLQPPIRPVSLELHRLSQALETLNQAALEFYSSWLESLPPGFDEWRRCVIELTYHRGVIGGEPETAKTHLAQALAQLRSAKDLDAAIKLRGELQGDWDLPPSLWHEVFTYFEDRELRYPAA